MSVSPGDTPQTPVDALDSPTAGARAIRGSALRTAGYIVGSVITLASAPLLIRYLGIVDAGRYFTVISLIALIGGITDVGLATIAVREYSVRTGEARDAFMRQILAVRATLTLIGVLAATAFAALAGYGGALVLGTVLAGVGMLLTVIAHTYSVALSADLRLGWLAAIDLLLKLAAVGLVVLLVVLDAGVVHFLAVPVVTGVGGLMATIALVRGSVPLGPSWETRELRKLLRETLPLATATVLATFYARITIIIMSLFASELATGYFGTASRLVEVAVGIPLSLIGATFPIFARAARDDPARLKYVLQRVAEIALIGGVWMTLASILAADPIAEVLVGPAEAGPVADVLRIIAVALLLTSLNVTWQTALVALRRHWDLLVVNGTALVVIVILVFALVPGLNEAGAAYAVVGGESCLMLMSAVALHRARPELRVDLRPLLPVLAAAAAAMAVGLLLPLPASVATVAASAAYFGVLLALGAIPHEVGDALAERLPARVLPPSWRSRAVSR